MLTTVSIRYTESRGMSVYNVYTVEIICRAYIKLL